jgi:hypothetical protein
MPNSQSNASAVEVKHSPGGVLQPAGTSWKPCLATFLIVLLTVIVLRLEGRVWWCACGHANLWAGDPQSAHSSQHLFDPYSFTHILHGVLICGIFALGLPRLDRAWALPLAVLLEAGWEILENSPLIIDRYRTATIALGYTGDSIINSLGDILSCSLGFLVARRIGWRWSIALVVATELILLFWIRDNLFLNIVMLIWPIDAIRTWQAGP